jgi:glucose-1-phosphate adenylyltransferase
MQERRNLSDDVTVLILGGGRGTRLDPLTRLRSKPAVPVAGKYRLIDIPISNAINSGLHRIYVLTQFNSHSLHRHIASTYRFDSFSNSYVQILAAQQTPGDDRWFQGTADAVRQYTKIVRDTVGDKVLILSGDHMYRMDYASLVRDHEEHGADVTLGVLPCTEEEIAGFGAVRVTPQGQVVEFREKPGTAEQRAGMEVDPELLEKKGLVSDRPYLASMGIYLFDKKVLLELLEGEDEDFGKHIMPRAVESMRVQAGFFSGYWRDIGTMGSFFKTHMELLEPEPQFSFYDPRWPFFTHPRFLPGARITSTTFECTSLAEGCRIQNSNIRNSVIGVRSIIDRATIERSLLMGADDYEQEAPPAGTPPIGIGAGTEIRGAIVDKNARIGRDCRIVNTEGVDEADGDGWAIRDGIVVIAKGSTIPDGTVI